MQKKKKIATARRRAEDGIEHRVIMLLGDIGAPQPSGDVLTVVSIINELRLRKLMTVTGRVRDRTQQLIGSRPPLPQNEVHAALEKLR